MTSVPTIATIAREADVSKATVSLALNGRGRVADSTRDRIRAIAERLNYQPREANATSRSSKTVTVVCARDVGSRHRADLFGRMINGVEKGLEAAGHRANLLIGAGPLSENLLSRRVLEEQSDAVILLAVREGSEYVQLVERLHVPAVVINARSQPQRFSYVGVDNHGGVGDAVGRLVEMGHRRLAMVHNTHQLSYNLERQQGFFDALRERGLEATATLAIDPEADTAEAAYLAAAEQVADAATAVCLTNDHMAVSFIDALETLGVSVPDDVSVVGFDATPSCAASGLRPSSVGYCIDRLAEEAASIIDRLLQEGGLRYLSAILPARFEPRDTTAPPRREASPKPRLQASQAVAVPKE